MIVSFWQYVQQLEPYIVSLFKVPTCLCLLAIKCLCTVVNRGTNHLVEKIRRTTVFDVRRSFQSPSSWKASTYNTVRSTSSPMHLEYSSVYSQSSLNHEIEKTTLSTNYPQTIHSYPQLSTFSQYILKIAVFTVSHPWTTIERRQPYQQTIHKLSTNYPQAIHKLSTIHLSW